MLAVNQPSDHNDNIELANALFDLGLPGLVDKLAQDFAAMGRPQAAASLHAQLGDAALVEAARAAADTAATNTDSLHELLADPDGLKTASADGDMLAGLRAALVLGQLDEARNFADQLERPLVAEAMPAHEQLVQLANLRGDWPAEKRLIEEQLASDPLRGHLWLALSRIDQRLGRFDEAEQRLERAEAIDGRTPSSVSVRLQLERQRRRRTEVLALARAGAADFPESEQLQLELCSALIENRLYEEAEAMLAGLPSTPRTLMLRANAAFGDAEFEEGFALLDQILTELPPSDPAFHGAAALLGRTAAHVARADQQQRALEALQAALAAGPKHVESLSGLVDVLVALGRDDEAAAVVAQIPPGLHDTNRGLRMRSWLAARNGDYDRAQELSAQLRAGRYLPQLQGPIHRLEHRSGPTSFAAGAAVVFGFVRDETLRLPDFLAWHRRLGIEHFVIVDHQSVDGTGEFLLAQPDVTVYYTDDDHFEAGSGMRWMNELIDRHAPDNWCIYLDADEHLVYPGYEHRQVGEFLKSIEDEGADVVRGLMLDMHPATLAETTSANPAAPLLETNPLFTSTYSFTPTVVPPYMLVTGGFRDSVLGNHGGEQNKTPIIRSASGVRFASSSHWVTHGKVSATTVALLHYKFLSDWDKRIEVETDWTDDPHFEWRKKAFRRLQVQAAADGNIDFRTDNTVRFESSQQLIDLGLLQA